MADAIKVGNVQIAASKVPTSQGGTQGSSSGGSATRGPDTSTIITDASGNRVPNPAAPQNQTAAPPVPAAPTPPATNQPTNAPAQTPPSTSPELESYDNAKKALDAGGLSGSELSAAQDSLANKYQVAHANATASGTPAPQDAGAARAATTQYMPPAQQDTSNVDTYMSTDKNVTSLMQSITQLLAPQNQTTSLMDDYNKLYKQSDLGNINKEIIDADTIINGTEGDIRNEIQTAGGFGTDSQVQAMALTRNKALVTRYNQLVQQKTDATNQLNTMMQFDAQDKQMAQTRVNTQIDAMFKMADFQQQAQNNIREAFNNMVSKVGYSGAYQAYAADPKQMSMIEQTMGLEPGGLKALAAQPDLDRQLKQAQIAEANRGNKTSLQFVPGTANQPAGSFNPDTGVFTPVQGTAKNTSQLATTQSNIQSINDLLKPDAMSGVGTNSVFRYDPLTGFTGKQQNFLAGVNQIKDQLTLDSLTKAKQNGATFGALSDGERQVLANSASKLGSWEVKDPTTNQVIGYNASPASFTTELNKINNYAKLDYVLKGGTPADVGIVQQPDGSYWTQNSDNTYTKIQ